MAAVVDAQAVTIARGVLQQVGANGDGQGFGGFDRLRLGFALQDAGDVLFAIQAGDEFVVEQKQFAIAVDIKLVAIAELDAVITLHRAGSHHTVCGQHPLDRVSGKQPDFNAAPRIRRPGYRQHGRQRRAVMAQDHLTGAAATRPDRRAVKGPTGEPALARCGVQIAQPAPGFHPQPTTEFTHDIAIRRAEHHVKQHLSCLFLRRHGGQHLEQLDDRHTRSRLQRCQLQQPRRCLPGLPVAAPIGVDNTQARWLEIQSARLHQRLIATYVPTRRAAIHFLFRLPTTLIRRLLSAGVHQPGVYE
ncbi:hypothetical protein D3C73_779710 [compost metagenome]